MLAIDDLAQDPWFQLVFLCRFFVDPFVDLFPLVVAVFVVTLVITGRPSARAAWRRPDWGAVRTLSLPYGGLGLGTALAASRLIHAGPGRQNLWRIEDDTYPGTLVVFLLSGLALGVASQRLRPLGSWVTALAVLWLCLAAGVVVTLSSSPFAQAPCPPHSPGTER